MKVKDIIDGVHAIKRLAHIEREWYRGYDDYTEHRTCSPPQDDSDGDVSYRAGFQAAEMNKPRDVNAV